MIISRHDGSVELTRRIIRSLQLKVRRHAVLRKTRELGGAPSHNRVSGPLWLDRRWTGLCILNSWALLKGPRLKCGTYTSPLTRPRRLLCQRQNGAV